MLNSEGNLIYIDLRINGKELEDCTNKELKDAFKRYKIRYQNTKPEDNAWNYKCLTVISNHLKSNEHSVPRNTKNINWSIGA